MHARTNTTRHTSQTIFVQECAIRWISKLTASHTTHAQRSQQRKHLTARLHLHTFHTSVAAQAGNNHNTTQHTHNSNSKSLRRQTRSIGNEKRRIVNSSKHSANTDTDTNNNNNNELRNSDTNRNVNKYNSNNDNNNSKPLHKSTNRQKLKEALDDAAKELNITHWEQWYAVPGKKLRELLDHRLFFGYEDKAALLQSAYPEHPWELWRFTKVPAGFWEDLDNQRNFIESLAKNLNITQLDQWYEHTGDVVKENGGHALMKHYKNSPLQLLSTLYPNHRWCPWLFSHIPRDFWDHIGNRRQFLDWMAVKLNITHLEGWYEVTTSDLRQHGGRSLVHYYMHPAVLVPSAFPEFQWLPWKVCLCQWRGCDYSRGHLSCC